MKVGVVGVVVKIKAEEEHNVCKFVNRALDILELDLYLLRAIAVVDKTEVNN